MQKEKNGREEFKELTPFFINSTFISNARLKLAKNLAKAKEHHEAELLTNITEKRVYHINKN